MPIQKCKSKGKSGWRWGGKGKCYTGPGARVKAAKQARAVKASQARKGEIENVSSLLSRYDSLLVGDDRRFSSHGNDDFADGEFGVLNVRKIRTSIVRSNPLKSDPTRTKTLRGKFERDVRTRIALIKRALVRLVVEEDAFGLRLNRPFNEEQDDDTKFRFPNGSSYMDAYGFSDHSSTYTHLPVNQEEQSDERVLGKSLDVRNSSDSNSLGLSTSSTDPLLDPLLFGSTVNQRFAFRTTPEQVAAFEEWLKTELDETLVNPSDAYWEAYVREGYEKGAGRAFSDTHRVRRAQAGSAEQMAFFEGTQEQFLQEAFGQTESIEKVQLLASRTLTDLKGVSGSVATRMSRILTEGLVQGMGPRAIAKLMVDDKSLGIDKRRAQTIARTEIIRAHAEGQLDAFERMGVEDVGVMAEWSTAGDDRVCHLCQPLEGVVLKVKEMRGILPRHPNCRCVIIPANVGEPKGVTKRVNYGEGTIKVGQKRSKEEIEKAIKTSVSRERKKGTLKEKLKRSKWRGADRASTIAKVRPKSILDTGVVRVPVTPRKVERKPVRIAALKPVTKLEVVSKGIGKVESESKASSLAVERTTSVVRKEVESLHQRFSGLEGIPDINLRMKSGSEFTADIKTGQGQKVYGTYTPLAPLRKKGLSSLDVVNFASELPPASAPKLGGFNVGQDISTAFRHEYGHHFHEHFTKLPTWQGLDRREKASISWIKLAEKHLAGEKLTAKKISLYAASNRGELFAESFAVYTDPKYFRGVLPNDIEKFFDKVLK